MIQSALRVEHRGSCGCGTQAHKRLSFVGFFRRYPVFLLAFGPPIFRSNAGINASSGTIDLWALVQVGLLGVVAFRAIRRLTKAESIAIPKQIQSIIKYAILLGLLFLVSAIYSPSHLVSASYAILYILTWICVTEFIVDVYKNPPNWIQCLFQLRMIAIVLLAVVILTLFVNPAIVMSIVAGSGVRVMGEAVAPMGLICSMIGIISAYAFCYGLEPKGRSILLLLIGFVGTLSTQTRGVELPCFMCLVLVGLGWAKTSKRSASLYISLLLGSVLFFGVVVTLVGGGRIWNTFNRGQSAAGIASVSGRTQIWQFVIQYCLAHPQGMGYIAGFRILFSSYHAFGLQFNPAGIGATHNSFVQVLADAGWLALAVYLILLTKVVLLGWRYAKHRWLATSSIGSSYRHVIRCSLILLVYCFLNGMDGSEFVLPLRASFYIQNILIGIVLSASALVLSASRARHGSLAR
jgi:hypothetical protein